MLSDHWFLILSLAANAFFVGLGVYNYRKKRKEDIFFYCPECFDTALEYQVCDKHLNLIKYRETRLGMLRSVLRRRKAYKQEFSGVQ